METVATSRGLDLVNANIKDTRPVHLYFGRVWEDLHMSNDDIDIIRRMSRRVIMCRTWADLPALLVEHRPETMCFSSSELQFSSAMEIVNMVRTLSRLVELPYDIRIAVDVGADTEYATVKMLQKSGIFSIIPRACDFGWDECNRGATALWSEIPYWPKQIIHQLRGFSRKYVDRSDIKLTPRQKQIFELICERGLSNKHLARTLNITESTVKLHVGKLFEKFGVKNRTQLVAFNRVKSKTEVQDVSRPMF